MSTEPTDLRPPRVVETVEELVGLIELTGVRCFEIAGRRTEDEPSASPETADDDGEQGPTSADALADGESSLQVRETHGPDNIAVRFRLTVEAGDADYVADFGLGYSFAEPLELRPEAIQGLLERVSVMSAWPFLREAIATTAARMELTVPVLGMVRQGQFRLQRLEEPATAEH